MKLYKPIYPAKGMGNVPAYKNTYNATPNGFSVIGQRFGSMPNDPDLQKKYKELGLDGHNGLDFVCREGTPVFAAHDGNIIQLQDSPKFGKWIKLRYLDGTFETLYGHLKEFKCMPGQKVRAWDLIGLANSTGISTGNHLHWGSYLLDGDGNILNYDNGFKGAVDPLPFIVETPHFEFTKNLWFGLKSEDVRNLQIALANEGFLGQVGFPGFTGGFYNQTREALISFQIKYGIISSKWSIGAGICGPKTRAKLNEIYI